MGPDFGWMPRTGMRGLIEKTPENLLKEVEASENVRNARIHKFREMVQMYTGPGYEQGLDTEKAQPENHAFEFISLMKPRTVFDNPRVKASSRSAGPGRQVARATQHGLNRWIRDKTYKRQLSSRFDDMSFAFGYSMVAQQPKPGYNPVDDFVPHLPQAIRISPRHAIIDPLALILSGSRYFGHMWIRSKQDILREAEDDPDYGWNTKLIESLDTGGDQEKLKRPSTVENLDRDEIVGYDLWIPEAQLEGEPGPDEGFHGSWFTVLHSQSHTDGGMDDWAVQPRPFYGPRWGPYTMWGIYTVPDSPYPLSPLQASYTQNAELNKHARAMNRSASEYKRLVLVNASAKKLQKALKDDPDSFVIPIDGLDKDQAIDFEVGGITAQQIEVLDRLRDRLDRVSGMSDAQRGNVDPNATATAEAIADDTSDTRTAYIKSQFRESCAQELRTVAWYLVEDNRTEIPLGEDAAEAEAKMLREQARFNPMIGRMIQEAEFAEGKPMEHILQPVFLGGSDEPNALDDLEIEIDPYSMERTNEALMQSKYMQVMELVVKLAPIIPQNPHVDWKRLLDKGGDILNDADFGDVINTQMAAQMMGMPGDMHTQQPGHAQFQPMNQSQSQQRQPVAGPPQGQQRGAQYGGDQRRAIA